MRRRAIGMVARETSSASFRSMASETVVESSSMEMLPAAVESLAVSSNLKGSSLEVRVVPLELDISVGRAQDILTC